MKVTRRSFLTKAALATATASFTAKSWSQVPGANSDIRCATVGFNGRGESHIDGFSKPGSRMVALCDVDENVMRKGLSRVEKNGSKATVETFGDIRKLLEKKDLDVVSIATPNHWHSLAAIWSIQAGKDVYCEKPVSHNVWEGRKVVEAARSHGKIVQTGTQSRSNTGMRECIDFIHSGAHGKVLLARGLCYKPRPSIGKVDGPQPIPPGVNYDLWCGPAPMEPLMRKRLHYDWHWVWPTGCGDLGNQGIHQMDIARWALGVDHLSPKVMSLGGRVGYIDDGTTPNTQIVFHMYDKAPLIFEVRGLPNELTPEGKKWVMDQYKGADVGVVVECENGHITIPSYSSGIVFDKQGNKIKEFKGGADHFQNFLKAVRSRRKEDLNADILEGHLSSALCHTGNISYRLGQKYNADDIKERIKSDKEATESFGRMVEHLERNKVDLKAKNLALGPVLMMDPKTERFTGAGAAEANPMLTRNYRAPYIIPDQV
jgi:predicted dehydrogenase